MSQKTKSIADALKSSQTKRQVPVVNAPAVDDSSNASRFDDIHSSDSRPASEERSENAPEVDLDNRGGDRENTRENGRENAEETSSGDDLIARLSRLQAVRDDDEPLNENTYDEQPHRATSRQRQQRSFGQDRQPARRQVSTKTVSSPKENFRQQPRVNQGRTFEEDAEYDEPAERYLPPRPLSPSRRFNAPAVRNDLRNSNVRRPSPQQPFRTSRRGTSARPVYSSESSGRSSYGATSSNSKFSEREYEEDYEQAAPRRVSQHPNTSRGRTHNTPSIREAYDRQWSTDSVQTTQLERKLKPSQNSSFRTVGSSSARTENLPRRGAPQRRLPIEDYPEDDHEEDHVDHEEDVEDETSRPVPRENSIQFTGLSKTIVTKISKLVGISSIASDVHETLKDLSGNFIYDTLSEAAQTSNTLSSGILEPIVEAQLGRQLEDLDESFLNPNAFARWVRNVADELHVSLRNEAVLFLQQVLEFYLVELLTNSRDVAEQARRSRVMAKDVLLASRMR
jgi:histone H3/H4